MSSDEVMVAGAEETVIKQMIDRFEESGWQDWCELPKTGMIDAHWEVLRSAMDGDMLNTIY